MILNKLDHVTSDDVFECVLLTTDDKHSVLFIEVCVMRNVLDWAVRVIKVINITITKSDISFRRGIPPSIMMRDFWLDLRFVLLLCQITLRIYKVPNFAI